MAIENMAVSKSRMAILPKPDGDRFEESGRSFMSIVTCYYTFLWPKSKDLKGTKISGSLTWETDLGIESERQRW